MKSDMDVVMQAKNLDALIVFGNAEHNPPMYYFTGGGHVSHATLIKKRGGDTIFFHGDMERDEAAKSGLKCVPYSTYDYNALLKQANAVLSELLIVTPYFIPSPDELAALTGERDRHVRVRILTNSMMAAPSASG